ncbi:uncharacterized protein LOC134198262 [Corticium candelabrum]|uniref:uncharacterized protein LOC134198262 n=1 Tax=Corticium candelabrum TaxID=121492 RepID=UPI002E26FB2F|nr:uncharacterized protein LOC134198262 [Corticium candelabrum]
MEGRRASKRVRRPVADPEMLNLEYVDFNGDEEEELGVTDNDSDWDDEFQRRIDAQAAVLGAEESDQEKDKPTDDESGVTGAEEEEGDDDEFADLLAADVPGPSAATVRPRYLVSGNVKEPVEKEWVAPFYHPDRNKNHDSCFPNVSLPKGRRRPCDAEEQRLVGLGLHHPDCCDMDGVWSVRIVISNLPEIQAPSFQQVWWDHHQSNCFVSFFSMPSSRILLDIPTQRDDIALSL